MTSLSLLPMHHVVISCRPHCSTSLFIPLTASLPISSADLGGGHKGTSFTWSNVTLPDDMVGKNVSLSLQDADGDEAWSDGVCIVLRCSSSFLLTHLAHEQIPYTKTATSCKNTTTTTTAPGTSTIPANAEATYVPSSEHRMAILISLL